MIKDALYTHKFANEKVALNAKEIVANMVKNSLSIPTIKSPSHYNGVSKDQNHVEVPEEQGIINVLDDKSKREAYLIQ